MIRRFLCWIGVVFLIAITSVCNACEFGKTYKDMCLDNEIDSMPSSFEVDMGRTNLRYSAFYINEKGIWKKIDFDENGRIGINTGYTWCGHDFHMDNPPPKGKCPYILYKSHRWYPQYHGIIYVYKDGREVK